VIGAVGRLSQEKGFDIMVKAVDALLKRGFDVELRIVGEGDQQDALKQLIVSLAREDRIRLLGYQAETIPFYASIDVFALSSLREGLPNVLLEAMALEVPVVATRIAGIPRLIKHEENGLLIDAGSITELTEALSILLGDSERRKQLGLAGRSTVEREHSFALRMQRIREIYDDLLGRNPNPHTMITKRDLALS
jgi:glycosyltransferase involved in cell wall biosynthesis